MLSIWFPVDRPQRVQPRHHPHALYTVVYIKIKDKVLQVELHMPIYVFYKAPIYICIKTGRHISACLYTTYIDRKPHHHVFSSNWNEFSIEKPFRNFRCTIYATKQKSITCAVTNVCLIQFAQTRFIKAYRFVKKYRTDIKW